MNQIGQFKQINFRSKITADIMAQGKYAAFKEAVKALNPRGGVAIAWFNRSKSGYISLQDKQLTRRIMILAKQFGFSASLPASLSCQL